MGDLPLAAGGGALVEASGEADGTRLGPGGWGDGAVSVDSEEPRINRERGGGCLTPVEVPGCGDKDRGSWC